MIATQYPRGDIKFTTYNAQRKIARHYYWVSGYVATDGEPKLVRQLRITQQKYNGNEQVVQSVHGDDDGDVNTFNRYNVFNEKCAEGPEEDVMIKYWEYDQAGNCWYDNDDRCIPTVTGFNLLGNGVAHYLAGNAEGDLKHYQHDYARAVAELFNVPYEEIFNKIQRTTVAHDAENNPNQQFNI